MRGMKSGNKDLEKEVKKKMHVPREVNWESVVSV